MRQEKFKMERQGLVEEGQKVKVTERVNGSLYSYVVEPAVAMSGIYRSNARIQSREGIIREIQQNDRGFYLLVVEYKGKQVEEKEMIAAVKKAWTKSGRRIGEIKTMTLYAKPEENAVYYVINGIDTGAVPF